jgi:hypothetical protein
MEFCPVCMLRKGLADGVERGESSTSEETIKATPEQETQRFEHYALVTGEDGTPVELGRGAKGVRQFPDQHANLTRLRPFVNSTLIKHVE